MMINNKIIITINAPKIIYFISFNIRKFESALDTCYSACPLKVHGREYDHEREDRRDQQCNITDANVENQSHGEARGQGGVTGVISAVLH